MHGIVFIELEKYVKTKLGFDAWGKLIDAAGLNGRVFKLSQAFPDEEAIKLVMAAEAATGQPAAVLLEDFGAFIAPDLLNLYGSLLKKEWKTLDIIENTEATIHKVVRLKNPGAAPPALEVVRGDAKTLIIHYRSPRKLCALASGIAKGIASHHREQVSVSQPRCMHRGDPACEIRLVAS